jgi:hypothetical protein
MPSFTWFVTVTLALTPLNHHPDPHFDPNTANSKPYSNHTLDPNPVHVPCLVFITVAYVDFYTDQIIP